MFSVGTMRQSLLGIEFNLQFSMRLLYFFPYRNVKLRVYNTEYDLIKADNFCYRSYSKQGIFSTETAICIK